jgi:hypothetical protein
VAVGGFVAVGGERVRRRLGVGSTAKVDAVPQKKPNGESAPPSSLRQFG